MVLRLLVNDGFQVLFHSPPGVLFTFPSRYWFAIGGQKCLALEGGPPRFPQGFSCPGVLGIPRTSLSTVPYGAVTVSGPAFQPSSGDKQVSYWLEGYRTSSVVPRPHPSNAGRLGTGMV